MYPDCFQGLGHLPGEFHITMKDDAKPTVAPPRKYPIQLEKEIQEKLDEMEKVDVIEKVTGPSDWVNQLAFERKKTTGELRVCLDPKDLNKQMKRIHHKAHTLEEITHKLAGAKVFSKLDAKHGYWGILLDESSNELTTFNSPNGRYRFRRLLFGLRVSQDIFQQKMDQILLEAGDGLLGIADDVCVFGEDDDKHDEALHRLMEVARKHGLVFCLEKCEIKKP